MNTQELQAEDVLARIVAPEDLCADDYVAILNELREYASFLWHCDSYALPPHEPVPHEVLLDRPDGAEHAGVVAVEEADHRDHQQ